MMEERISSRKNPLIQQLRRLLTSRSARYREGRFVADGTKLLEEAVRFCPELETVVLTDGVQVDMLPDHVRLVRVPEDVMASVSPMESPQGALFVCRMPRSESFVSQRGMLLLDGIQDPGNVGTILRTADAMDVPVVLLEGCADPYNWKTVRASMGAVFRVPVTVSTWEQVCDACTQSGSPIGVTALSPRAEDIRSASVEEMAVVIGSEGRGVRRQILDRADRELIIPMNPHCESLNAAVASTIVMWQMRMARPD